LAYCSEFIHLNNFQRYQINHLNIWNSVGRRDNKTHDRGG